MKRLGLFIIGMVLVIMGAMFKIMHYQFSEYFLGVGMIIELLAVVWFLYGRVVGSKS